MTIPKLDKQLYILRGLNNDIRQSILLLLEKKAMTVDDILSVTKLNKVTLREHLTILRDIGVIGAHPNGSNVKYVLKENRLKEIIDWVQKIK